MTANRSAAVMQQRHEAHDSLDDFPTPPWATRALCQKLRAWGEPLHLQHAWEPCCNRGHMAMPLGEEFDRVYASDIHDYGWAGQQAVSDFLIAELNSAPVCDWVVANPPFRLALEFIQRGLEVARRGVAVFVRTSFVEGQDRFARLFQQTPERFFMPFVERAVLWKGVLLDPDVKIQRTIKGEMVVEKPTTATSYCWLVFERGFSGLGNVWRIEPCRQVLTRPGDYPPLPDYLRPDGSIPGQGVLL
ncbi:MAG: hypothetical protein AAGL89_12865 [Pseudomonadota bacterium]